MSTLSFFLRVILWTVLVGAYLHSRYDERTFGALIHEHALRLPRLKKMIVGPGASYQLYGDTYFHRDTPEALVHLLDALREKYAHVQIHYGNVETGLEKRVVTGYVERSKGSPQLLLLVQLGEPGGVAILDHHVVRLVDLDRDWVCYQHPAYHQEPEEAAMDPTLQG